MQFLTTENEQEQDLVRNAGFSVKGFPAGKLRRYWNVRNILDCFVIVSSFVRAIVLLATLRPSLVVSAGSFLSVPIAWAAWTLRIRVAIHQLDVRKGLANRLMTPCASLITVAFPESIPQFPTSRRVVHTGNPVRESLQNGDAERARRRFHFPPDKPVVLVLGGSTGSQFLNTLVHRVAGHITTFACLLHAVGSRGEPGEYEHGLYRAVPFFEAGLADAYALADIVVSRAGLSTMSELALLGKPAIIVPMPGTHQEENAEFFYKRQAVVAVQQSMLTPERLSEIVRDLLENDRARKNLSRAIRGLAVPDAARRLTDELLALLS